MNLNRVLNGQHIGFGYSTNLVFEPRLVGSHDLVGHCLAALPADRHHRLAGYCRPVLLVNGTTTTRARFRLAALLLTMTAGRVLRISLPTAGSNSTHHTSLRCIGHVSGKSVAPLHRFGFARLVGSHRPVA